MYNSSCVCVCIGSIPWLMVSELFLQEARPIAVGIATIVNWFANFTVGLTFPYILVSTLKFEPLKLKICDLYYFCRNTSIRMGPVCLWWRVVHCGSICIDIFLKLKDWVWSRSPQGWGGASGLSILSPFTCVWISPFYVRILCDRCGGGYACAVGAARIKRRTYAAAENVAGRTER